MLISNNHAQNNKKFKFLVIEEETATQKSIELLLSYKFDCKVYSVDTGEEGVAAANNQLFNLIFINISPPGADGLSAIKMIRQQGINKHTPIIATSGILYEEKFCSEAGINAFLAKPFTISDLEEIIKKLLQL